jgi:hypothetical protein
VWLARRGKDGIRYDGGSPSMTSSTYHLSHLLSRNRTMLDYLEHVIRLMKEGSIRNQTACADSMALAVPLLFSKQEISRKTLK